MNRRFDFSNRLVENAFFFFLFRQILFLASEIFVICVPRIFWAAKSKSAVKIFDFQKLKMLDECFNFSFSILDPPSSICQI